MVTDACQPAGWWREAVFYEVYVRSFADGGSDGVGDLIGVRERLPHLVDLGVDALWLTPFYPSPMADGGYDVADPRDVDPRFGTLTDFDALTAEAHRLGLKLLVDLVPNHTSDKHDWFREALADPASPARDRYIFRTGKGVDGELPPNNWPSVFGGPAWQRTADRSWYLHLFAAEQPDLNWDNADVLADLDETLRFWLDRGADGFRIDVAHGMAKPEQLPDLPPSALARIAGSDPGIGSVSASASASGSAAGVASASISAAAGAASAADPGTVAGADPVAGGVVPSSHMPEADDPRWDNDGVHAIHRRVHDVISGYPGRMAVGEAWVRDDERLARYVRPGELDQVFNFRLLEADWGAAELHDAIMDSIGAMSAAGAMPTWVLSNHDVSREVTRYGGGELGVRRARAAALLLLALPGAAYIYNGGELGLADVELPDDALQDPTWERSGHTERGRDGARVPLPWAGELPPYDFTTGTLTWLPMPAGWAASTVAAEAADGDSVLSLYRLLLRLRRRLGPVRSVELEWLRGPADAAGWLSFRRCDGLVCVVNTADRPTALPAGDVIASSLPLQGRELPGNAAAWLE